MNSPKTESPSSLDPGFSLVAGALAGFIIAFELSLLELLVWATGSYAGMDYKAFACMSLQSTARVVLGLLVAGIVGGLLWTALLRIVPAIRRLATQSALSLWVLGSFVYSVFGSVSVARSVDLAVIDALTAFALAIAAYHLWRQLLRWLRRGHIWRVILAVAAMNVTLWIPLAAYFDVS